MNEKVKDILEWIYCIVIAVVLALLFRYYIGTPTIVKQVSMYPTLVQDQRLWLNRWGRTTKKLPERGDIITFEAPSGSPNSKATANLENPVAKFNEINGTWNKFVYYVLEKTKASYIKRVIGLPGDRVEIKNDRVYINGEELEEPYLQEGILTDMEKGAFYDNIIVPENTVYVMGDNRGASIDSRVFGCIPLEKIESKLAFRFWPFNLFGKVD